VFQQVEAAMHRGDEGRGLAREYREGKVVEMEMQNIEFAVHGVHAGTGGPVRLLKPIADYYYPQYVGAHVDLVKTMTTVARVEFDGRPALKLQLRAWFS
jgi:hypothetical protein